MGVSCVVIFINKNKDRNLEMMTPRKLVNLTWPQGHFPHSHINLNNNYIVFSIETYAFISVMLLYLRRPPEDQVWLFLARNIWYEARRDILPRSFNICFGFLTLHKWQRRKSVSLFLGLIYPRVPSSKGKFVHLNPLSRISSHRY